MKKFGSAAILAGGRSVRMGFDKQLLTVQEKRISQIVIPSLKEIFDDIIVVTNTPDIYEGQNVRCVQDIIPVRGSLTGIHSAVVNSKSKYVYIIACDMPRISLDYINYMKGIVGEKSPDACVTRRGDWIEPFNAFYSKTALPTIEGDLMEEKASVYYAIKKLDTFFIPETDAKQFCPDLSMFLNLNTREDYNNFLASLESV